MTLQQIRSPRFAIVLVAAVLCFASIAQAGPPLICHTIEIGQASPCPGSAMTGTSAAAKITTRKTWSQTRWTFSRQKTPVLVRMETLRSRHTLRAQRPARCEKNSWRGCMPARLPRNPPATPTHWPGSTSAISPKLTSSGSDRNYRT